MKSTNSRLLAASVLLFLAFLGGIKFFVLSDDEDVTTVTKNPQTKTERFNPLPSLTADHEAVVKK
jgi:hypothetical protein